VIATGSSPSVPRIPGLDTVPFWGTREATSAREVPDRLAVIGGGVAAVELAQIFAALGSRVTILARSGLLGKFPRPAVDLLQEAMEADGIDIRTGTTPTRVSQEGANITLALDEGESIVVDRLLVSTGRKPALGGIGLESIGLEAGKLEVDDTGRVAGVDGDWLYAVGDAAGRVQLTHQGKYEARATGDAIAAIARGDGIPPAAWTRYRAHADHVAVPSVVFTDPEIAHVGLTLEDAKTARGNAIAIDLALDVAGATLLADGYAGWAQIVVDADQRVIVGATFAGQDVAEMLHAATIAIVGEVPLNRLWHAVPSYPTMSEVWLRLLESLEKTWRERFPGVDPFMPAG
jgi:dihydrolipoamide dehydrogenase